MNPIRKKRSPPTTESRDTNGRPRKAGRPMKRADELAMPKSIVKAQLRESHRSFSQPDSSLAEVLSPLERLPNEVIQQIFFNCFEINLPKVSRYVAQALSTESTYRALILFAFFEDDGLHPVETKYFLPVEYVLLPVEERTRLQSGILCCRWCTLDRIKIYLPTLCRLAMAQAWYGEKIKEDFWDDLISRKQNVNFDQAACLSYLPDAVQEIAPLPAKDNIEAMEKHYFVKADYVADMGRNSDDGIRMFDSPLPRIITWAWVSTGVGTDPTSRLFKYQTHHLTTLAVRMLPDWLVRGSPWTKGKIELLQLLRQGSRFLHHAPGMEVSTDSIIDGMASAIREQNTEALLTLLELHNGVVRIKQLPDNEPQSNVVGAVHRGGDGMDVIHDNPQPRQPLPSHLFHLAAKAGAQSADMMALLIRGNASSIPHGDVSLTAWALEQQAEGSLVAHWLLEHMAGTVGYERATGFDPHTGRPDPFTKLCWTLPRPQSPLWKELGYLEPCQYRNPRW